MIDDCEEEVWSWDYFNHEQLDGYWTCCSLGDLPHEEHEDQHTGLKWKTIKTKEKS